MTTAKYNGYLGSSGPNATNHRYLHIEPRLSGNWGVNLLQGIQKGVLESALLLDPAGNIFPEGLQSKNLEAVPLVVTTVAGGGHLSTTLDVN